MTAWPRRALTHAIDRCQPAAGGRLARAISQRARARRFELFTELIATLPRPLRVLDIGGTPEFWREHGWAGRADIHITLFNHVQQRGAAANMTTHVGDAADLGRYPDRSFDLAFSNSVIEHLFTRERQQAMANEVQRVADAFWVQTPNFWFPVEPHFYVPTWQWWPTACRVAVLRRLRCGCRGPCPDPRQARRLVDEVRLVTRRELATMFPRATFIPERVAGLVKSWIAVGGTLADTRSGAPSLHLAA